MKNKKRVMLTTHDYSNRSSFVDVEELLKENKKTPYLPVFWDYEDFDNYCEHNDEMERVFKIIKERLDKKDKNKITK